MIHISSLTFVMQIILLLLLSLALRRSSLLLLSMPLLLRLWRSARLPDGEGGVERGEASQRLRLLWLLLLLSLDVQRSRCRSTRPIQYSTKQLLRPLQNV